MAFRTADLIKETSTSTGIGALTLLGARTPGRPFSATCANGDTFEYCITHATLNEYEIGLGTYSTTGPTITRTTIYASSNSGSAVSFSAGVKNVDLVQPSYTILSPAGNAVAATISTANLVLGVGDMFNASSTGTITTISFDTVLMSDRLGRRAVIRFTAVRTITHNASTLILPTGANITTAIGDTCEVESLGGGTGVRMLWYTRANGRPLSLPTDGLTGILRADSGTLSVDTDVTDTVSTATTGAQGKVALATNADVLTGTNASLAVTPDALAAIWEAGVDNTGGATITLGDGGYFNLITSTTTITAFAFTTDKAGRRAQIRFNTARVLTHNATSLILPFGGANITTEVGDKCVVTSLGSGNFIVTDYERGDGRTILGFTDPNIYEMYDDFEGGVIATPIYPWTETNSAAGTNSRQVAADHPGILRLTTGAVSGNNKRLHLGVGVSDGIFTPTSMQRFSWVVRIPTITTVVVRLGLMQDISATSGGTAGAYFEFDPVSSANWRYITRQASASTANNALAVTANNWYVLEAKRLGTGNWEFWVNGSLRATNSATLPTTTCNFGCFLSTVTAAARNVDLDMAGIRSTAQRFT